MSRREDEYLADSHPKACTCVACNEKRLGRKEDREWSRRPKEPMSKHRHNCKCKVCTTARRLLDKNQV